MNSSFAGWCWLGMLVCSVAASASFAEEPFEVLRPIPEVLRDVNRRFQSAPSLTISRGGRLWCVWHTGGEGEGNDNCAMMVTSGDGGDTWSGPLFAIDAPGELRVLDPGLWTDPNGKVWLFYAQVKDFWDGRGGVWVMHPVDPENAASEWTKARRISDGYLKNKPFGTGTEIARGLGMEDALSWPLSPSASPSPSPSVFPSSFSSLAGFLRRVGLLRKAS